MTDIPQLMRGAEPQFYRGNHVGCLVVHGFMASPGEVGWAGEHLAAQGYTVYVPRLTGHGIDYRHMTRMKWQDWYGQVLDGYHILRQQCDTVIAIGHSMGGLLSLLLAVQHPLEGLAVCGSPLGLGEQRRVVRMANLIHYVMPYTRHPSEEDLLRIIDAEQQRRGVERIGRVHYEQWASRAIHQFYLVEQAVQAHLHRVTAPLLLLYAANDETGSPDNAERIARSVRSNVIDTHILQRGGHIIFQDEGREEAFAVLADFVARMTHKE